MKEQNLSKVPDSNLQQLEFVEFQRLFDQIQDLHETILRRAYEIFEENGRVDGHALDHWLAAEKEFLQPIAVELAETGDALKLRARVPGFTAKDLKISVEPRRLAISGSREWNERKKFGGEPSHELRSSQIFHTLDLPCDVDPSRGKATLRDGVLELALPKAGATRQLRVASTSKVA